MRLFDPSLQQAVGGDRIGQALPDGIEGRKHAGQVVELRLGQLAAERPPRALIEGLDAGEGIEQVRADVTGEHAGLHGGGLIHAAGGCKLVVLEHAPGRRRGQAGQGLDGNGRSVHLAAGEQVVAVILGVQ